VAVLLVLGLLAVGAAGASAKAVRYGWTESAVEAKAPRYGWAEPRFRSRVRPA